MGRAVVGVGARKGRCVHLSGFVVYVDWLAGGRAGMHCSHAFMWFGMISFPVSGLPFYFPGFIM